MTKSNPSDRALEQTLLDIRCFAVEGSAAHRPARAAHRRGRGVKPPESSPFAAASAGLGYASVEFLRTAHSRGVPLG